MKRFYKDVTVNLSAQGTSGYGIFLDGRPVKAPAGNALAVPTQALADAIAEEWQGQGETIEPAAMPLTQLAFTAMDRVADRIDDVILETARYAETDLVCYRAEGPDALTVAQAKAWDPLIDWLNKDHNITLNITHGITAVPQSRDALDAVSAWLKALDPFRLSALAVICRLAGSLVIAFAVLEGRISGDEAADAAQVDDLYQREKWGADQEADARLAAIKQEIGAADRFIKLIEEHKPTS